MSKEWFNWNDRDYIKSRIRNRPQPNEGKILDYLKSDNVVSIAPAIVKDVFSPEKGISGVRTYTDGEWDWDTVLAYYVEKYHFQISDEFAAHMRKNNWEVRKMTREEIHEHWEKGLKPFEDRRAAELLESGLRSISEGLSFKVYNLKYLIGMCYKIDIEHYWNNDCIIDGIQLDPFGKDISLHEFCYAYDNLNSRLCKADIYVTSNGEKKIKYAMHDMGDGNYVFWKIID